MTPIIWSDEGLKVPTARGLANVITAEDAIPPVKLRESSLIQYWEPTAGFVYPNPDLINFLKRRIHPAALLTQRELRDVVNLALAELKIESYPVVSSNEIVENNPV